MHEFPPGRALEAALDPDDIFIFDPEGRLAIRAVVAGLMESTVAPVVPAGRIADTDR